MDVNTAIVKYGMFLQPNEQDKVVPVTSIMPDRDWIISHKLEIVNEIKRRQSLLIPITQASAKFFLHWKYIPSTIRTVRIDGKSAKIGDPARNVWSVVQLNVEREQIDIDNYLYQLLYPPVLAGAIIAQGGYPLTDGTVVWPLTIEQAVGILDDANRTALAHGTVCENVEPVRNLTFLIRKTITDYDGLPLTLEMDGQVPLGYMPTRTSQYLK